MRKVDSKRRSGLLNRLRQQQSRRSAHALTPTQRLEQSMELLELAADRPTTDEPRQLWVRIVAELRERQS